MSEIADILDRAADLIEPEGAWIQGPFAVDGKGKQVEAEHPSACAWCAAGAITRAAGGYNSSRMAAKRLADSQIRGGIICYSESERRTQAQVVAKLREAAAKARTPQYALKNGRV